MGYANLLLAAFLLSAVVVNGQDHWLEKGSNSSDANLTNWLLIVEADGEAPTSSNNADAEFIVEWNNILIDYLALAQNTTQITTEISPSASNPWIFQSTVTQINSTQSQLLRDLVGDQCSCWDNLNNQVGNATSTELLIERVTAEREEEPSSSSSSDDDDNFGTGEIVGIVFGALLIYYCCFMVAAGIFYMLKALFKKLRSRGTEELDSEDEELGAMGKMDDSEEYEEDDSVTDDSSSENQSDSDKKESTSGNTSESSKEESSSEESSSEESS